MQAGSEAGDRFKKGEIPSLEGPGALHAGGSIHIDQYAAARTRDTSRSEGTAETAEIAEKIWLCVLCGLPGFFLYAYRFEVRARFLLDVLVQAVAMRVHRHDRREVLDLEMPHRFGRAELEQRHIVYRLIARA